MKKVKLIALLAALAAGLCLYLFLQEATKPVAAPTGAVVTAAVDIREDTVITAEMLQYAALPPEAILPGAVTDAAAAVGQAANADILAGEQLLARRLVELAPDENVRALSYTIPDGLRAMTISVTETSGLSGMLLPGNRVDVVLLHEVEAESKNAADPAVTEKETSLQGQLALQNVSILAVGQTYDRNRVTEETSAYKTVTLALTPEQALKLSLAQSVGQISLLLRSQIDAAETELEAMNADILD